MNETPQTSVTCPKCNNTVRLPRNDNPVLVVQGEVYLPKLVAVLCQICKTEIRLE